MLMSFGKYKDKPVAWVLLKKPEYIRWMHSQNMTDRMEFQFAIKLMKKFDVLPFKNARCSGSCNAVNSVTRLSLYKGQYNLDYFFCDKCELSDAGAYASLQEIRSISQAITHSDNKIIVSSLARAKGVPKRLSRKALSDFFDYEI